MQKLAGSPCCDWAERLFLGLTVKCGPEVNDAPIVQRKKRRPRERSALRLKTYDFT
jgi:hypothetical protein